MRSAALIILISIQIVSLSPAQKTSDVCPDTCRRCMHRALAIGGSLYAVSTAGLYQLWYKQYTTTSFHFFNDNRQWLQMDKVGHLFTSYSLGRAGLAITKMCGDTKSGDRIWATSCGLVFLTSVEVLDGFSTGWGASLGDVGANVAGAGLVIAQDAIWLEQRITMKFSYHQTSFPQYNPTVLGSNFQEQLLKDYNGQTYWLSISPGAFMRSQSRFPRWLCLSIGYSGEEMIKGSARHYVFVGNRQPTGFVAYRQYFLSIDLATDRIKVKQPWLRTCLSALSFIKIPMPAMGFSSKGVRFYPIYF